ncbi:restriction endonuclease [Nocardia sp. N2S4-5]|uniref:restriction endonuclease n=1 Tax=Nocardia sp. N2S4-5 TaxID=3351565 RepID=UPI0037D317EA
MDWEKLDWEVFEALVALLMQRVGFVITSPPDQSRGPDTGVDFVVRNANEQDIYVQAKHSRRPPTSSQIRQVAETSRRLRAQLPDAEFFLVSSSDLRPQDRDGLAQAGVTVWDRMYLDRLLESNPDVAQRIEDATEARDLTGLFEEARRTSVPTFADRVAADLATIPPGYQGWKLFEKEAARILTEIFLPDLDPPDTQVRTDDGLDIMDATTPFRTHIPYGRHCAQSSRQGSWWLNSRTTRTRLANAKWSRYANTCYPKHFECSAYSYLEVIRAIRQ